MLSLSGCSVAFVAPAVPPPLTGLAKLQPHLMSDNSMEPDEGWNVENLMDMMDMAEDEAGGPTTKEIYDKPVFDVKKMPGITGPLDFFDPAGFSNGASEGRLRFYREVELKHGRVGMLASVGFLVGENFHPLWGGNIDVPSYLAFQETPLQAFWPAVVLLISVAEVFSVFSFESPTSGNLWSIRSDHEPGNLGFDPLKLKPAGGAQLLSMQNAELNNGRLAMIAAAGMIVQEAFVTHAKLF
jgi:hypothetical protein